MSNHLSTLGIIHTVISIIAVITAVVALVQAGKINPKSLTGKWYIVLTILTCLTGLPIMRTGHPTPGHTLAVIVLIMLPVAMYAKSLRIFGNKWDYAQLIIMSATLFLSMIPAVNETLTRLPVAQPLAAGPDDPLVKMSLLVLFVIFLIGVVYQVIKLRAARKPAPETLPLA
jgi:hypothetical protein